MSLNKTVFETAFNTYTALEIIGEGGSGRVFKVQEDSSENQWAIKTLHPERTGGDKRKRFKNEIRFGLGDVHPNIVRAIDHGVFVTGKDQVPFYVMPLYHASLRLLMKSGIRPDKILPYFAHMLDGVEAAHILRVTHRDLKPENFLHDSVNDRLLVADFGIASFQQDQLYTLVETKADARLANFQYAAPEQRSRGRVVDERADIYALGLILNEMFTGQVPHGTRYKTIANVSREYEYLDAMVEEMLRQEPAHRPASIEEIKKRLIGRKKEFVQLQRISELKKVVVPVGEIDDALVLDPPRIVGFDWDPNSHRLVLRLSRPINEKWELAFKNTGYQGVPMGQTPSNFTLLGNEAAVRAEEHAVQEIIDRAKQWMEAASKSYQRTVEKERRLKDEAMRDKLAKELEAEEARRRVLSSVKI